MACKDYNGIMDLLAGMVEWIATIVAGSLFRQMDTGVIALSGALIHGCDDDFLRRNPL